MHSLQLDGRSNSLLLLFYEKLEYDPVIGLGLLLSPSPTSSGGDGRSITLIVEVVIAVIVAAFVSVGVITLGFIILSRRKRRSQRHLQELLHKSAKLLQCSVGT